MKVKNILISQPAPQNSSPYSDIIANAIIEDKSLTPFAAPAFRTIEIRYMLEDDYVDNTYLTCISQIQVN